VAPSKARGHDQPTEITQESPGRLDPDRSWASRWAHPWTPTRPWAKHPSHARRTTAVGPLPLAHGAGQNGTSKASESHQHTGTPRGAPSRLRGPMQAGPPSEAGHHREHEAPDKDDIRVNDDPTESQRAHDAGQNADQECERTRLHYGERTTMAPTHDSQRGTTSVRRGLPDRHPSRPRETPPRRPESTPHPSSSRSQLCWPPPDHTPPTEPLNPSVPITSMNRPTASDGTTRPPQQDAPTMSSSGRRRPRSKPTKRHRSYGYVR
jgi:hypothetical protein